MHKILDYVQPFVDVLRRASVLRRHQSQMFYRSRVTMLQNRLLGCRNDHNNFHTGDGSNSYNKNNGTTKKRTMKSKSGREKGKGWIQKSLQKRAIKT